MKTFKQHITEAIKQGDFVKARDGTIHKVFGVQGTNLQTGKYHGKDKYGSMKNYHITKVTKIDKVDEETTDDEKTIIEDVAQATARVKKAKHGVSMSFTHHKQGKVTGKYKGMGRMGGRSFAKIATDKELHYVPPHEVHEEVDTE